MYGVPCEQCVRMCVCVSCVRMCVCCVCVMCVCFVSRLGALPLSIPGW